MTARNIPVLASLSIRHDAVSATQTPPHRLWFAALIISLLATTGQLVQAEEYRLVTVADELQWPWSVAKLPEGGFLITEREGRLIHLEDSGERHVLEGTPETLFAGQGGYFDVLLHPEFAENSLIYLSYAEGQEAANGTAIFRAEFRGGKILNGKRILRVAQDKTTPQHYGAKMMFLEDQTLLVTTGDGFEHREEAQSQDSELGKVLRIYDDGSPAGLLDAEGEPQRIWTLGHRNPQGLAFDASSGTIYLHEHGPRGGDEINRLEGGNNYGWPAVTHGVDYSGAYVSPFKAAPGFEDPVWTWVPSIAPSGMAWYGGGSFPTWRNSLFVGALVDQEVRRLELRDGKVVKEDALFSELETRIRDVRVFGDEIYLLTDSEQGALIRVQSVR
ncbi:PQQ-dependent sugar dehydrogenase [Congregibacter brevis]|uniref:PQQ-dependent sugar dehydrogenase n=1 Tax=Congregibacter brevis TaxID=3081201 RepID=A0ABZ0IG00_9GAMM|nr:PQQ-dependent sugar dehydrogenase [Congregibacter sp. IMCC45268]